MLASCTDSTLELVPVRVGVGETRDYHRGRSVDAYLLSAAGVLLDFLCRQALFQTRHKAVSPQPLLLGQVDQAGLVHAGQVEHRFV